MRTAEPPLKEGRARAGAGGDDDTFTLSSLHSTVCLREGKGREGREREGSGTEAGEEGNK